MRSDGEDRGRARVEIALGRTQQLVNEHCSGCHDAANPMLDLSKPLTIDDRDRMERMLSALASYEMPPPPSVQITVTSEIERLYPLSSVQRVELINSLDTVLALRAPDNEPVYALTPEEWIGTVVSIMRPWVPANELEHALQPPSAPRDSDPSGIRINLIAREVCRAMTTKLMAQVRAAPSAEGEPRELVRRLLRVIYGVAPSEAAVRRGVDLLQAYAPLVDKPDTPLSALCATHLSGPKLTHLRVLGNR
jgi:hypothetical protein